MRFHFPLLVVFLVSSCGQLDDIPSSAGNALSTESSPYLLQHAHNPVYWYPWKPTALEKAKAANKLMIISIGYAACHWCHVMEEESFSDSLVARLMNDHFVSIKVDREERPDVDNVYMTACELVSERGCGWPLNIIALPDGKPVWVGTYLSKPEWLKTLDFFHKAYEEEAERMEQFAIDLTQGIQQRQSYATADTSQQLADTALDNLTQSLIETIDLKYGGKKGSPKFPLPKLWEFLLHYHYYTNDSQWLEVVLPTLDGMANGGIYDHLAGGFARYTVDERWKVPHFEKMLYDNGQLVSLYAKAFQLTQNEQYRQRIEQTLSFLEAEMSDASGGFYASMNADSEGEEGRFYVWNKATIDQTLSKEEAQVFNLHYGITDVGNWEKGKNILSIVVPLDDVARQLNLSPDKVANLLLTASDKLRIKRATRIAPSKDNKLLTAWNALMLKGYADAYAALGDDTYRETALRIGEFITTYMLQEDGSLLRNFMEKKASIHAFADDYALTIEAFIRLYEITFDDQWLACADQLTQYLLNHFVDKESGLLFFSDGQNDRLISKQVKVVDHVIPSANSVFARSLWKLGALLYQKNYQTHAQAMLYTAWSQVKQSSQLAFFANWGIFLLEQQHPLHEVAIVGPDCQYKRDSLLQYFLPNAVLLGHPSDGDLALLENKYIEGQTMIYVCLNKVCKLPVENVEDALSLIE